GQQHDREHADHELRGQPARAEVESIKGLAHEKLRWSTSPRNRVAPRNRLGRASGAAPSRGSRAARRGCYFLYASMSCWPSAPALPSHSCSMVAPTFCRSALSAADGGSIVMPLALSVAMVSVLTFSDAAQPRASASAAALSRASCVGLSRASNARLFTITAFLGNQA